MEYTNPNDAWMQHHDDKELQDMSEEDMIKAGCWRCLVYIVMAMVAILLSGLIFSCKQTEYITVPEVHNEHHWHTDSVHQTDSIIRETQTIIMQLDSAAMAKYGITLKGAQQAWLVKTAELERQIQMLLQMNMQKDSVHDSIPVPYPVIKEVPAELTWWQQTRLHLGGIVFLGVLLVGIIMAVRWWLKQKHVI